MAAGQPRIDQGHRCRTLATLGRRCKATADALGKMADQGDRDEKQGHRQGGDNEGVQSNPPFKLHGAAWSRPTHPGQETEKAREYHVEGHSRGRRVKIEGFGKLYGPLPVFHTIR